MSLERAGVSRSIPSGAKAPLIFGSYGVTEATPRQSCNIHSFLKIKVATSFVFSKNQSCNNSKFLNFGDQIGFFDVRECDVDGRFGRGLLCLAFLLDGREVDRQDTV